MCFDRPVTVVALKRLGAGVFAVVPRQLVAPGESPLAALPRALVRLLTWGMKGKKNTHEHLFTCVQGNKENTRGIQISVATMLTFDMFFAEIKVQIFPPPPLFLFFFSEKRASRWTSSHRSAILLNRQKRSRGGKREVEREKE